MDIPQQQLRLRQQLERQGISDVRVLDAIQSIRRELFIPEIQRSRAYDDNALPIGYGQTISQPYIVALMTQALALQSDETVLEIGTGSGYQTAILAKLAGHVVTVERIGEFVEPARTILNELNFHNVSYRQGDGTLGEADHAPYDAILVTAAAPEIPQMLWQQLEEKGRMVIPVGDQTLQTLLRLEKHDSKMYKTELCDCRFVKLIGQAGWPTEDNE